MELIGLVGVVMLSVGLSLAGARTLLGAGLFLMLRAAESREQRHLGADHSF